MNEEKTNGTIFTKDHFIQAIEQSNEHMKKIYGIIEELKEENEKLREALEFYADEKNWTKNGICFSMDNKSVSLIEDKGFIAREILEKKE